MDRWLPIARRRLTSHSLERGPGPVARAAIEKADAAACACDRALGTGMHPSVRAQMELFARTAAQNARGLDKSVMGNIARGYVARALAEADVAAAIAAVSGYRVISDEWRGIVAVKFELDEQPQGLVTIRAEQRPSKWFLLRVPEALQQAFVRMAPSWVELRCGERGEHLVRDARSERPPRAFQDRAEAAMRDRILEAAS